MNKTQMKTAADAKGDWLPSKPINIRELWARVEAFVPAP